MSGFTFITEIKYIILPIAHGACICCNNLWRHFFLNIPFRDYKQALFTNRATLLFMSFQQKSQDKVIVLLNPISYGNNYM